MERRLKSHIKQDLKDKLVFLSGPRQVGKTTLSKSLGLEFDYINYDFAAHRKRIRNLEWNRDAELVIFDELHKMKKWKAWLKGIYDVEGVNPSIIVTGSARMDVYRKGGDSLAGRYFSYRLHPVTVKEASLFMDAEDALERIIELGGFPEPFLKNDKNFASRWRRRHLDLVLKEDLRDLDKVKDIHSIEILVDILRGRVGVPVSYSSLAEDLQVSVHTVKRWLKVLEMLYIIFPVRTYHKNIARSILKATKYYFYDTGAVDGDRGQRLENAVACCLQAQLHYHEDTTGARVELAFVRNKQKQEVDFLTLVDKKPRHLIEVKLSDDKISRNIVYFSKYFPHIECIQLVHELAAKKSNRHVKVLPAADFLSRVEFS